MRVSTTQFYFQNQQQMSNKQAQVTEQSASLSSGKRVETAKDDAISFGTLSGYKNELTLIEGYKRNITQAQNRNGILDVSFASGEKILDQLKQTLLQANNGVRSSDDLASLAQQARNTLEQMLDIANSQDESGDYIFAGYQVENKPFSLQPDNSVIYSGDSGVRDLRIAKNVQVPTNQDGEQAFEKIMNATGDFSANYTTNTSGVALSSATIVDRSTYNAVAANPQNFTFNFTAPNNVEVRDQANAVVVAATPYTPGQTIAFQGIEVKLNGTPNPGDSFEIKPEEEISIFETIKSAIAWMTPATSTATITDEQRQVDYNTVLGQLNKGLNHLSSRRAEVGINLQLIESQSNNHLDNELNITKNRSSIEDLDYAKAISQFEQSKTALQIAQQTFTQVQRLTLFDYI